MTERRDPSLAASRLAQDDGFTVMLRCPTAPVILRRSTAPAILRSAAVPVILRTATVTAILRSLAVPVILRSAVGATKDLPEPGTPMPMWPRVCPERSEGKDLPEPAMSSLRRFSCHPEAPQGPKDLPETQR